MRQAHCQGKADITKANDANPGFLGSDGFQQLQVEPFSWGRESLKLP